MLPGKGGNMKFYFTYGLTELQPFQGGWTEVEAPDINAAIKLFRFFHPDRTEGVVNCASIYTEEQFRNSCMAGGKGCFGKFCRERISREVFG